MNLVYYCDLKYISKSKIYDNFEYALFDYTEYIEICNISGENNFMA